MATAHQLAQYCLDHGYVLQQKGSNMSIVNSAIGFVTTPLVVGIAAGYIVARIGLPQLWSDVQGVWSWIRNKL